MTIESTNEWTFLDFKDLHNLRRDQSSFHVFSEKYVRGEIFNLAINQQLKPSTYDGNVIITCINGSLDVKIAESVRTISELQQILINPNIPFKIKANKESSFQIIWSPSFAKCETLESEFKDRLEYPIEFIDSMLRNFQDSEFPKAQRLTQDLRDIAIAGGPMNLSSWIKKIDFEPESLGSAFFMVYQFAKDLLQKNLNEKG
jgi:hypothetical protein